MAEITKEQVEEFLQFNIVPRGIAVTTFCGRLAELALTALRQQEGMVLVLKQVVNSLDRAIGDSDVTHIESDSDFRERFPVQWAASKLSELLAASERDQRGAAAGASAGDDVRDMMQVAPVQATAQQSVPHQTAAGQVERSRNGADGRVRSGDGGSHTATGPSPASAAAPVGLANLSGLGISPVTELHESLLRGIALGIEAARMVVVQAHAMVSPDSPAGTLLDGCDHTIRSLQPANIAAKNPTDDAAGRV